MASVSKRKRKKPTQASLHRKLVRDNRYRYEDLLANQGGHCALCPAVAKTRKLDMDHDHKRMVIRGLLCVRCNRALRAWMTREWLAKASLYVEGEA